MSYATNTEFLTRYDSRVVAQLLSDSGTAASDLTTNAVLAELLSESSGLVEAACFAGERYTSSDLDNLTGNSESLLKRLVCDLTMWHLKLRRGDKVDMPQSVEKAYEFLEQLKSGARVFDVAAVEEVGHANYTVPTAVQLSKLQLLRDDTRFYPARREPLP